MKFRPCIDIHNGKVKQIVGGSLTDKEDSARENFIAEKEAPYYAGIYRRDGLTGGHVILLNPPSSPYYEATKKQALNALCAYPGGMQIGGGITAENAYSYIEAGASHVIVTSYVLQGGRIRWDNLDRLKAAVGKEHIVLDLSCRSRGRDGFYIVTDRWQTYTDVKISASVMEQLADYCDEFLVHGVDVEGKASGISEKLVRILSGYEGNPVTYAGGIGSMEDLELLEEISEGRIDFTIGSALDLFGGEISYQEVRKRFKGKD